MTKAEEIQLLQREIAEKQARLAELVLGDQREIVSSGYIPPEEVELCKVPTFRPANGMRLVRDYCPECQGPCRRRPRHGDGMNF